MTDNENSTGGDPATTIRAADGRDIPLYTWLPEQQAPVAILQLFHGLSEHAARYGRFARQCTARGYAVVAHNHRGHGAQCSAEELGHFANGDGWNKVIGDAKQVHDHISKLHAGLPLVLLGHSMGSYIAQSFVMRHSASVTALILSGSTWPPRMQVRIGRFVAWLEMRRFGAGHRSMRLNAMGFGAFNKRFQPARTDFDWLSRDADEVDKYIGDPLCGAIPSAGLWHDLLGGLLEISSKKALRAVPPDLPVLITGGAHDPVGGTTGMTRLAAAYKTNGHAGVSLKIYPEGRHEMLNETNRDAVTADLLQWAAAAVA